MTNNIDILGFNFSIDYDKSQLDDGAIGGCFGAEQKIFIHEELSEAIKIKTIIHEAVHAYDYMMGINLKESQVVALETAIYCLIRDNKDFIETIK